MLVKPLIEEAAEQVARASAITRVMRKVKVIPKRRPGRPATGKDPLVALRFPPTLIKTIDAWARANGLAAMRALMEEGLKG